MATSPAFKPVADKKINHRECVPKKLGKISGILALSGMSATSARAQSTTPTLPPNQRASADHFYNLALGSNAALTPCGL